MKIVIANGPPFSGKDTICKLIHENIKDHDLIPMSYKETLYIGVATRYGLSVKAVFELNADPTAKDLPSALFGGKSVRQALIYESEEVIKKELGESGVAIKTFQLLEERYGKERLKNAVLVCSDGGFNSEMHEAYNYFGIDVEDVYILQMLREGCSFKGDSREFLRNPDTVIHNDGDIAHLMTYMPRIQSFCDGFVTSSSRYAHIKRNHELKNLYFWKYLESLKPKKPKPRKPKKDRNKGLPHKQTFALLGRLNAK